MRTDRRGFLAALIAAPVLARIAPAVAPAVPAADAIPVIPIAALGYEFLIDLNHIRYVYSLPEAVVRVSDAPLLSTGLRRAVADGRRGRRAMWQLR